MGSQSDDAPKMIMGIAWYEQAGRPRWKEISLNRDQMCDSHDD